MVSSQWVGAGTAITSVDFASVFDVSWEPVCQGGPEAMEMLFAQFPTP